MRDFDRLKSVVADGVAELGRLDFVLANAGITMSHGAAGYTTAKHGVIGLMRYYATSLAEESIRVNTVHPSGVGHADDSQRIEARITDAHPEFVASQQNLLPIALIEPESISDTMVYLCAPSGRYITGVTLPVDAGLVAK